MSITLTHRASLAESLPADEPQPTGTPQPAAQESTATNAPEASEATPSETPSPETGGLEASSTPGGGASTATPNSEIQTAEAAITETAVSLEQTRIAISLAEETANSATATAEAPYRAEIAALGLDPDAGQFGFTHPPISLSTDDFQSYEFDNQNPFTIVKDFVLAADITWASRFAESGCGFVVRSDGNEEALNQYIIGLTRGAQGHVLFAEQVNGEVDLDHVTNIYANGIDPRFEWQSNTTNRVVVVGRGQQFSIYSNGTFLGTVNGTSGFDEGFVAFIAVNRSGGISCDYDNIYLWKLDS